MEILSSDNVTDLYMQGLRHLRLMPDVESRVGKTKEACGVVLELSDIRSRKILEPLRRQSENYIKAELIWYFSQTNKVAPILKASSFWKDVTDDGITVNSNYGEKAFEVDSPATTQFDRVCWELDEHPNSRRAMILYMTPQVMRKMTKTNDFICNIYSHFLIRNGRLDQYLHTRSCDFIYGWGNDLPFFTLLQEMVAVELDVKPGRFIQVIDSLHLYERHFPLLQAEFGKWYPEAMKMFPALVVADVLWLANFNDVKVPNTDFAKSLMSQ